MLATPIYQLRDILPNGLTVEAVVWQVPVAVPGCSHPYKYRLYCGRAGTCLVRYDNERGKGDHKHLGNLEVPYGFVSIERLMADFIADVERLGG
ncbi:toxin-antitoxin system TumE family protein [Candidatus Thiodictyon syntrophicum]|jgi:hypothetical protein|uniref:Uncharacterized protein n=1 Tax=Candidatus Thiodictyon syntrophicum TaxID=1166950 RepID=A0A2K8UD91_9GAMM|nr:DUF6516 family protein [Candidatus Thiodictyon syntrophicum]AUB83485.1 hypothetical protein THSYN_22730 [Candidatus Thiodictyon syntrophicum]